MKFLDKFRKNNNSESDVYTMIDDMQDILNRDGSSNSREVLKLKLQQFIKDECETELNDLSDDYNDRYTDFLLAQTDIVALLDMYQTYCNELDKLGNEFIVDYDKVQSNPFDDLVYSIEKSITELPIIPDNCNMSFDNYIKENNGKS